VATRQGNPRTAGGAGGAASGTAMVALAQQLGGVGTWPGGLLTYGAPAIAVVFGAVVAFLGVWGQMAKQAPLTWLAISSIDKQLKDTTLTEKDREELLAQKQQFRKKLNEARIAAATRAAAAV
jgi:hypothetical protein